MAFMSVFNVLPLSNRSFIALLCGIRVRTCKHFSSPAGMMRNLSVEMLGGQFRGRDFCPIPACSPFLAVPVLVSLQGVQWCLHPKFSQHPSWISREFSTILSGNLLRKFHQLHSQFSIPTEGFPVSSTSTTAGFPAKS